MISDPTFPLTVIPRARPDQPKLITDAQDVIEREHGCESTYCRTVHIADEINGIAWDGFVMVFDLPNHARAGCCYAWRDNTLAVLTTVLNVPPIDSAESAIRAALSLR